MERIIEFNDIKVPVTWNERLKPFTDVYIHTSDPGLAQNIIEFFLDEMGKHHLWYESGWLDYEDYQEIKLTEADGEWEYWSRERILSNATTRTKR